MKSGYEGFYSEIIQYSKDELFSLTNKCILYLTDLFTNYFSNDDDRINAVIDLVFDFMMCDDVINEKEQELFNSCFETSFEIDELLNLASLHKETGVSRAETIKKAKEENEDIREATFLLGLCVCAVDENISSKEQEYLESNDRVDISKLPSENNLA